MLSRDVAYTAIVGNLLVVGIFSAIWLLKFRLLLRFDFYKITLMAMLGVIIFGSFASWILGFRGTQNPSSSMFTLQVISYGTIVIDVIYGLLLACIIYPFLGPAKPKLVDIGHMGLTEGLFAQARRLQNFQWWLVGVMLIGAVFFEYVFPWL